jgi:hypothetical protein
MRSLMADIGQTQWFLSEELPQLRAHMSKTDARESRRHTPLPMKRFNPKSGRPSPAKSMIRIGWRGFGLWG